MDKGGRPSKLTPEIQEEIVKVVKSGNYIETACAFVGINKSTLYDWMKRGAREIERLDNNAKAKPKKSEVPYVEFSNAIKSAMAQSEIRDVAIIGKAAATNWQAAAWRLERKHPSRWGRKDNLKAELEHSGEIATKGETKIDIVQQVSVDEESRELLKKLWRRSLEVQGEDLHD